MKARTNQCLTKGTVFAGVIANSVAKGEDEHNH